MSTSPPNLADLIAALRDEEQARTALQDALHRQVAALRSLKDQGLVTTIIAAKLGNARGSPLTLPERQRVAARLRQRVCRVTRRHGQVSGGSGCRSEPTLDSDRALPPVNQESIMSKLIKRKVVEETFEADEADAVEFDGDEADDEVDDEESEEPTTKRRRK